MAGAAQTPYTPIRDVVEYELLFDCVHCGLCLEACPTYVLTRAEMDSPRGRIYLMKSLAEGRLELDADAVRHLDLCLGCRGCETACPSGVRYGMLIERARAFVEHSHLRSLAGRIRRRAIGAIFPYPARLRMMLAPLRLAERARLRPAIRGLLPGTLGEWLDLLPPLAPLSGPAASVGRASLPAIGGAGEAPAQRSAGAEARPTKTAAVGADGPAVAVHHGCVARVLAASENLGIERALGAAGYRVVRLEDAPCCGALDLHGGYIERALRFARANVRALKRSGAAAVVSAASGCAAAMAEYGELLKDDAQLTNDARQVSAMVKDLSQLLLARNFAPARELRCIVTYHDACHLAHGLGIRESPRKLLRSIPGVRLVELAESDLCCGSAGSYNLTEPAMARDLVRRKADNVIATGADYLVLSNPGCQFQIAAELRRRGAAVKVVHLAEFIAMAAQA